MGSPRAVRRKTTQETTHDPTTDEMASPEELDTLLIKSLLLLEWRLKRLEFIVGGGDRSGEEADASNASLTILARLDKLEKKWQRLVKQERIAGDINELCTPCS